MLLTNRHSRRRLKAFGEGQPRPLTRQIKIRLMAKARAKLRATEARRHYGEVSAKAFEVFRVLLWEFHNAASGLCFPSYEAIAEKAGCARSTVAKAIKALEDAGLLTWVHRIKRVREIVRDMFGANVHGQRSRVLRTSNGYQFTVPDDVKASKSEIKPGTTGQESFSLVEKPKPVAKQLEGDLAEAFRRLKTALRAGSAM